VQVLHTADNTSDVQKFHVLEMQVLLKIQKTCHWTLA